MFKGTWHAVGTAPEAVLPMRVLVGASKVLHDSISYCIVLYYMYYTLIVLSYIRLYHIILHYILCYVISYYLVFYHIVWRSRRGACRTCSR